MSKAFGKDSSPSNSPMRNTWDHTFVNHLTARMGCLHPILVKEVLPGDSVRLTTTFGLRFMPLYFPVQTRMRAYIHYFYVRSRNLWDEWPDFISNTKKNLVRPYFSGSNQHYSDVFKTGQLGDYLGLPTTIVGDTFNNLMEIDAINSSFVCFPPGTTDFGVHAYKVSFRNLEDSSRTNEVTSWSDLNRFYDASSGSNFISVSENSCVVSPTSEIDKLYGFSLTSSNTIDFKNIDKDREFVYTFLQRFENISTSLKLGVPSFCYFILRRGGSLSSAVSIRRVTCVYTKIQDGSEYYLKTTVYLNTSFFRIDSRPTVYSTNFTIIQNPSVYPSTGPNTLVEIPFIPDKLVYHFPSPVDISTLDFRPFGTGSGKMTINCETARAYESIYNAFYRDERNNPLIINGQPEYQKFLANTSGGSDSSVYRLHYRNWEQDMYTTAVPSPQHGLAPLVGIESNGVATFFDPDSDKEYQVQLVSSDGENIDSVEYLEKIPKSVARSLVNVATSGISINTFRNVNSYQRWLETNIRKGFKYKDQIKGHYGVDVAYNVLDMPEFIGGVTEEIQVQQINQNSQSTEGNPLGSYAGQAYAVGKSRNTVSKYFDEHGYLIGILCVAPVPSYSQLLPKHFLKRELLDIYFPEFGKIGYQPITYSEVAPFQTILSGGDVNEVFGYQRPWYDYLASVDEVHGEFRTTLRDFLINRVFDRKPYLGPDFTVMNDSQMNNIFSVQASDDKILGQILFDMQFKRPIPKSGIASLE